MKTLVLKKEHFKETENYWKEYVGTEDVSNFEGNIEIEGGLGYVRFSGFLRASGFIRSLAGSGIEAGWGIKAGWGIEAGFSISCNGVVSSSLRIFAGVCGWRIPTADEQCIVCTQVNGIVAHGTLQLAPAATPEPTVTP